jgi:hypothetical protein
MHISLFSTLVALAPFVDAGRLTRDSHESPFGITFSPSAVLASRFNSSGLVEVVKYPISTAYRTLYDQAITDHGKQKKKRGLDYYDSVEHNGTISLFRQIISPINESLAKQLGHGPTYASLFLPSVFDDKIKDAAVTAVFGRDRLQTHFKNGATHAATSYAYPFHECKYLHRAPEDCNWDGPENLILLLEYEEYYLHAFLKNMGYEPGASPVVRQELCKECGEKYRDVILVSQFIHPRISHEH